MTDLERLAQAIEHQAFALDRLALAIEQMLRGGASQRHPLAARDVAPGRAWYFRDHRTMREVIEAAE